MKKFTREIKIGLLFVFTAALFFWGFNFLKGKNLLQNPNVYYVVYDNVKGLNDASPVMLNGFPVGNVNEISLMPDLRLLVSFSISNQVSIPLQSKAALFDRDIMGSKGLDILLYDTNVYYSRRDTIQGVHQMGLADKFSEIEIEPLLSNMNNTLDSVQFVLSNVMNAQNQDALSETLLNLQQTTSKLSSILSSKDKEIVTIIANLENITSTISNNSENMDKILANFSAISDSLHAADLKPMIDTLHSLLSGLQDGTGTIGQLFKNDSLYRHVDSTIISLNKLLQDIENNPKKYVHFSLFGRKN